MAPRVKQDGEFQQSGDGTAELERTLTESRAEMKAKEAAIARLRSALVVNSNTVARLRSELAARDEIIAEQTRELQAFRSSKLQRIRNTILYDKFSIKKIIRIAYLVTALATPKWLRAHLNPTVRKVKRIFDEIRPSGSNVRKVKQEKWPAGRPLISIIVPCFNYGRYIEEAIDSVLSQTFQGLEIIVVDGGSTETDTVHRLQTLQKPKTNICLRVGRHLVGDNRNFGIAQAKGKYICCLDADDKLRPTYLEKALFLLEYYNYDLVSTAVQCFGQSDAVWEITPKPTLEQISTGNQFSTVAVFSKALWSKAHGYHDWGLGRDYVSEDWDLWVRMMALGARVLNIRESLMLYRSHSSTSLSNHPETPPYDEQAGTIRSFNKKYLNQRSYRRSAARNAAVVEAENPFVNLVPSSRNDHKIPAILLALPFMITGGADTVFLGVFEHLAAHGFDLSVITTIPTDATFGDNSNRYEAITKQIYHLYKFLNNEKQWKDFLFYLIASKNIDILFLAGSVFVYNLLPEIKQRFPKITIVDQLFNEFGHLQNNRKYSKYIDVNVVASENLGTILIHQFGEADDRTRVIIHGVDVKECFNPDRIEIRALKDGIIPPDKFVVSFVGRFSEEKCPGTFVEIANLLRYEEGLHFLMIGNGPEYSQVMHQIRQLQLESRVYAPGFVPDLKPFLRASGVVIIPSSVEGIPIILMESLALGVPVIASAVGGIPSIIRNGFNGFLCEPSDIEGFAEGIRRVADDKSLHTTMKRNAREYAMRHLDVDNTNRGYTDLFVELLGKRC
jgi:glycosyltransferase involved in cell wall biosynthesis